MPKQNLPSLCAKIAYISSAFLLLALTLSPSVIAQEKKGIPPSAESKDGKVPQPPSNTIPMQTAATVADSITVDAGLLPRDSAAQLFGGWVADRFAVVHISIENNSLDQQFELEKISFDYADWALSGIYAKGPKPKKLTALSKYQKGNNPGFVASEDATHVQESEKSASVFSPRNLVVNGLVMIGSAAGGFAFLGPSGFTQAVTGYNSDLIPALEKFWPDRRIDQESNLLTYGYRQGTIVIGKAKSGQTYAFFPYSEFLISSLVRIFLKEPAVFFNPAELFIDPRAAKNRELQGVKQTIEDLLKAKGFRSEENALKVELLTDLLSPCYDGTEEDCPASVRANPDELKKIQLLKDMMQSVSLHTTRVVVEGIMTENVDTIPAFISGVTIDPKAKPEEFWVVKPAPDAKAGGKPAPAPALNAAIEGKYLTNGTPTITDIAPPPAAAGKAAASAKLSDYLDASSIKVVSDGSSDTKLNFSFELKESIPPGSTLTFMVSKKDASGKATDSMKFPYKVTYTAAASAEMKITAVEASDGTETDVLTRPGNGLKGTVTGTGLKGASLTLGKVMDAGKDTSSSITEVKADPGQEDDTKLTFAFNLVNKIPAGSTVSFTASTTGADKQQATGELTVKSATAKPEAQGDAAGKKPAGKKQPVKQPAPAGRKNSHAAPTGTK